MITKEELIKKYTSFSDKELFAVYTNISTYSEQAKEAFEIVINQKGGLENFLERKKRSEEETTERHWIKNKVSKLYIEHADKDFIKEQIKSDVLNYNEVTEIIEEAFDKLEKAKADKAVTPKTIYGSIWGGILASIIGGIYWGLQLIFLDWIFGILVFGLGLICYAIVAFATKQSKENTVVLITTAISFSLSLLVGQFLLMVFGYHR